jgi:hypothetical protein
MSDTKDVKHRFHLKEIGSVWALDCEDTVPSVCIRFRPGTKEDVVKQIQSLLNEHMDAVVSKK